MNVQLKIDQLVSYYVQNNFTHKCAIIIEMNSSRILQDSFLEYNIIPGLNTIHMELYNDEKESIRIWNQLKSNKHVPMYLFIKGILRDKNR